MRLPSHSNKRATPHEKRGFNWDLKCLWQNRGLCLAVLGLTRALNPLKHVLSHTMTEMRVCRLALFTISPMRQHSV